MDISEQYIRMCIESWPDIARFYRPLFSRRRRMLYSNGGSCERWDDAVTTVNHTQWYPLWEQDQLQEMVGSDVGEVLAKFQDFIHDPHGTRNGYYIDCKALGLLGWMKAQGLFHSMEQLWLAFVMHEKFAKHWSGSEWIKEERNTSFCDVKDGRMTREQIMALSGEELRVKVAEARGWTDIERRSGFIVGHAPGVPQAAHLLGLDDWPTDMTDAWELVEEAYIYGVKKLLRGELSCRLFPDAHYYVQAEGPAICRAYLLWKLMER